MLITNMKNLNQMEDVVGVLNNEYKSDNPFEVYKYDPNGMTGITNSLFLKKQFLMAQF